MDDILQVTVLKLYFNVALTLLHKNQRRDITGIFGSTGIRVAFDGELN